MGIRRRRAGDDRQRLRVGDAAHRPPAGKLAQEQEGDGEDQCRHRRGDHHRNLLREVRIGREDALQEFRLAGVARDDGAMTFVLRQLALGDLLVVETQACLLGARTVTAEAVLPQDGVCLA